MIEIAQTQKFFEQHFGADAIAVANPLEDGKSPQRPAICETIKKQHLQRPSVDVFWVQVLHSSEESVDILPT